MQQAVEINLENTLQAIDYLLKPNGYQKDLFTQFDNYLQKVEKSKQIWAIAHQILVSDYSEEVKFFASKFLKNKIMYDFEEVNQTDFQYLLQNITFYLKELNSEQSEKKLKKCKSQLIMSFVYFYMHTFEQCGDLVYYLTNSGLSSNQEMVVEILQYIAEESNQERLVIEESRRVKYQTYLSTIQLSIFQSLAQLSQEVKSLQLKHKLIRTFDSWLELTKDHNIDMAAQFNNPVVKMGFQEIGEVELFDVSGNLICNIIRLSAFGEQSGQLQDFVHTCFAKCQDMLDEEFIDEVDNYVQIFNVYGDHLLKHFGGNYANQAQQSYNLLFQNMINVLTHENYQEVYRTVEFFTYFIRFINKQQEDFKQTLLANFSQQLLNLIYACIKKCQYDSDMFEFNKLDTEYEGYDQIQETKEMKKYQRKDTKIIIEKLIKLIGFKDFFQVLQKIFTSILSLDQEQIVYQYRQMESVLFILCCALTNTQSDCENSDQLLEVIMGLINRNINNEKIQHMMINVITKSARIIANINNIDQYLNVILKYLSFYLNGHEKNRSILAISQLCRYNSYFVQNNINDFMDLYEKLNHDQQMVQGLVVSLYTLFRDKNISFQDYQNYLLKICQPFASNLLQITQSMNEENQEVNQQQTKAIVQNLDRFSNIIIDINKQEEHLLKKEKGNNNNEMDDNNKAINQEHPFVMIFKTFWPIIIQILKKYNNNVAIVEKTARFCKHSMRYLNNHFIEFLPELFEIMITNYNLNPLPSYLYLMEVSFSVFDVQQLQSKENSNSNNNAIDNSNIIVHTFNRLVERTFQEFQGLGALDANPQLNEDFFGMLFRCAKYSPQILNHCHCLDVVMKISSIAIGIQHIEANKALYLFWEQLLNIINSPLAVNIQNTFINSYGSTFVFNLLKEIENVPNPIVMEYIMDVVLQLLSVFVNTQYHSQVIQWFTVSLQNLSYNILVQQEKQLFLQALQDNNTNGQVKYLELVYSRAKQSKRRKIEDQIYNKMNHLVALPKGRSIEYSGVYELKVVRIEKQSKRRKIE